MGDEVRNDRIPARTQPPEYCGKMMSNQSGDSDATKTFVINNDKKAERARELGRFISSNHRYFDDEITE